MTADDIAGFLVGSVALFKDFPGDKLRTLIADGRMVPFERNEALLHVGSEGRRFGVVVEGEVTVSLTDDGGSEHQLAVLKSGDIFGEMSLMTGDKTMAAVIGRVPGRALMIPDNLFSTVIASHPPAIRFLSRLITERSRVHGAMTTATPARTCPEDPYGFRLTCDRGARLLVINCGSSSLKYNFFDTADERRNVRGVVECIGDDGTRLIQHAEGKADVVRELPRGGHGEAFAAMAAELMAPGGAIARPGDITAIGHRVVHGGEKFRAAVLIDSVVEQAIADLSVLAPLHNPVNLTGIVEAKRLFPDARHVAVFDTAFHHTLPSYAYLYGLPYEYGESKGVRRYGFHGTSHAYVAMKAAETVKRRFNELQMVSCHLGNGASLCAIDHGRSIDTSMGMTPAEGLIMGTRSGTIDPAIPIHLMRTEGMDADALDRLINRESGLKGLSGLSNDMRAIEAAAEDGHHRALVAFKTFCYQIRKQIGAYVAAMGGLDTLIFTGGIGQGSAGVRGLACQGLAYMGIIIDEERNRTAKGFDEVTRISSDDSFVSVLVVPTDEERMIARETLRTLDRSPISGIIRTAAQAQVPIEVSAHHVHLSQDHVEILFGQGHQLVKDVELSQPGQYACRERVNLLGPKGRVDGVRVLGPTRKETQIEIAMTEQFRLGIHPPIRESGDIRDTPGVTLEGNRGQVTLAQGVICAHRHIHMSPEDALKFGLRDKYLVQVRIPGARELIFGDVLVRVHPDFRLSMHIDTDEGNAANISTGMHGYIAEIQNRNE